LLAAVIVPADNNEIGCSPSSASSTLSDGGCILAAAIVPADNNEIGCSSSSSSLDIVIVINNARDVLAEK
jgi:hypothetical protein